MHSRNVEGLRQNAQKKREEAIARTGEGIKQLIRDGRPVNFKTVAEVADVSTAWLYKEPEIKARIEHLREQETKKKKAVPPQQKATEASKDAKYQALKKRLQEVEAENRGLREHLEAIHGRQRVLADENEAQRREIQRLTKLLEGARPEIEALKQGSNIYEQANHEPEMPTRQVETAKPKSKVTSFVGRSRSGITDKIQAELDGLNIPLNPTLRKTIKNSESEQKMLLAIQALKEAKSKGDVPNPVGFLVRAIKEGWVPSEEYEQKVELDAFNEWYRLAKSLKLVGAATQFNGVQHVCTVDGEWIPFSQMIADYPLEKLQGMS